MKNHRFRAKRQNNQNSNNIFVYVAMVIILLPIKYIFDLCF